MRLGALVAILAACGDSGGEPAVDAAPAITPATKYAYLVFDGMTLSPGENDATMDRSTLVTAPTTLPAFLARDPQRDAFIADVIAEASEILAPYDIDLVTERPAGRYMMIAFTANGAGLGFGDVRGIAVPSCGVASGLAASSISLQFEQPDLAANLDARVHLYAAQIVAEIGMAYGVPEVTTPGNCLCWSDAACSFSSSCTLGEAALYARWMCRSHDPVDTADEFLLQVKPRPQ